MAKKRLIRADLVVLCMSIVFCGMSGCTKPNTSQETSDLENTRSQQMAVSNISQQDLAIEVSWPESVVLGEPIVVKIILKNNWTQSVILSLMGHHREVSINVFDSRQQHIDRTAHGIRVLMPEGGGLNAGSAGLKSLKPSEYYTWEKDLNKCFELVPGHYTVNVAVDVMIEEIQGPSVTTLSSEDNEFEIKAP